MTEPEHNWDEHKFVHYMGSEFGLVMPGSVDDFVLYSKCACGKTPLDALKDARDAGFPLPEAADGD